MQHAENALSCNIVRPRAQGRTPSNTKLPTRRELKATVHEDGVPCPGLGGEDTAILHDDLCIKRPPTTRTLLHHETHDILGTRGCYGLSSFVPALILSQADGIGDAHDSS